MLRARPASQREAWRWTPSPCSYASAQLASSVAERDAASRQVGCDAEAKLARSSANAVKLDTASGALRFERANAGVNLTAAAAVHPSQQSPLVAPLAQDFAVWKGGEALRLGCVGLSPRSLTSATKSGTAF
jgi:hypothetical protein